MYEHSQIQQYIVVFDCTQLSMHTIVIKYIMYKHSQIQQYIVVFDGVRNLACIQ
jgi:hypothetical protein